MSAATSTHVSSAKEKTPPSEAKKQIRLPKSTSFKDLIEQKTVVSEPTQVYYPNQTKTENNSYSQKELRRCWNAYAERLEKQAHLKNTMLNCLPVLKENDQFEVTVHNPVQQDELAGCSTNLLNVLRTQLGNSHIQMLIRIDETNEKKLAYTASEKYEHLSTINPLLDKLKEVFDLTID